MELWSLYAKSKSGATTVKWYVFALWNEFLLLQICVRLSFERYWIVWAMSFFLQQLILSNDFNFIDLYLSYFHIDTEWWTFVPMNWVDI